MECTLQAVIILPNGNGEFRGIGLIEVIWKTASGIVNCQIRAAVRFHEVLNGFRVWWGTGTASLESKLIQKLITMR